MSMFDNLHLISAYLTQANSRPGNPTPTFYSGGSTYKKIYTINGDTNTYTTYTNQAGYPTTITQYNQTWDGRTGVAMRGYGDNLEDIITGGSGNDILWGNGGSDILYGREGDDILITADGGAYGGDGRDLLIGGITIKTNTPSNFVQEWYNKLLNHQNMTDTQLMNNFTITNKNVELAGMAGNDTIIAAGGNDQLSGGTGNDLIFAGDGNDFIYAGETLDPKSQDNDTVYGEGGNDYIFGGHGDDLLYGGTGDDTIIADAGGSYDGPLVGNDTLFGEEGNDSLSGGDGNDYMDGGADDDTMDGGTGNDTMVGGAGNDTMDGGTGNDTMVGGAGNDKMDGGADSDYLDGGAGNDSLSGGAGNDTLLAGNDDTVDNVNILDGGDGDDLMAGGLGADKFIGGAGNDTVSYELFNINVVAHLGDNTKNAYGATGDTFEGIESLIGGNNSDILFGNAGANQLSGNNGNDTLDGGAGDDILSGGAGNDLLIGSAGYDFEDGGAGNDTYMFSAGAGYDHIFEAAGGGTDNLYLKGITDVGIYKQGNHLLIATSAEDVLVLDNWFVNQGVEYIDFEATQLRYLVSDLASLAVEIQSAGDFARSANLSDHVELGTSAFETVDLGSLTAQGISPMDIPTAA